MSATELLKGCPLFYELYDNEIQTLVERCNVYTFQEGKNIITEGDEGNEIFVILAGQAEVRKTMANQTHVLASLGSGDLFGEMVLINQNKRTADVVATAKTDVLVIEYGNIFDLYKEQTKIFAVLLLNMARLLTKRLEKSSQLIRNISSARS